MEYRSVYLTAAYMDDKTLERASITESFGYISKPFEENDLGSGTEMALSKHKMEGEPRGQFTFFCEVTLLVP